MDIIILTITIKRAYQVDTNNNQRKAANALKALFPLFPAILRNP